MPPPKKAQKRPRPVDSDSSASPEHAKGDADAKRDGTPAEKDAAAKPASAVEPPAALQPPPLAQALSAQRVVWRLPPLQAPVGCSLAQNLAPLQYAAIRRLVEAAARGLDADALAVVLPHLASADAFSAHRGALVARGAAAAVELECDIAEPTDLFSLPAVAAAATAALPPQIAASVARVCVRTSALTTLGFLPSAAAAAASAAAAAAASAVGDAAAGQPYPPSRPAVAAAGGWVATLPPAGDLPEADVAGNVGAAIGRGAGAVEVAVGGGGGGAARAEAVVQTSGRAGVARIALVADTRDGVLELAVAAALARAPAVVVPICTGAPPPDAAALFAAAAAVMPLGCTLKVRFLPPPRPPPRPSSPLPLPASPPPPAPGDGEPAEAAPLAQYVATAVAAGFSIVSFGEAAVARLADLEKGA